MFPQTMSRSEIRHDDSYPDPIRILEQHLLAGFPLDQAADLVLSELVVRAAEAVHATAAALALLRNREMVCCAATGYLAPELGVLINTRDGLFGACLQSHQPQLSVDTEFDPRVDPAVPGRLGIRSILIVPVFDPNNRAHVVGVLEVSSTSTGAFSDLDEKLLEGFASECARVQAELERSQRRPATPFLASEPVAPEIAWPDEPIALEPLDPEPVDPEPVDPELLPREFAAFTPLPVHGHNYAAWTLVLPSLAILAFIAIGLLIASRVGWLHLMPPQAEVAQPIPAAAIPAEPAEPVAVAPVVARPASHPSSVTKSEKTSRRSEPTPAAPAAGELVVYEKGKVIFRMKSDTTTDAGKNNQPQLNAGRDSTRKVGDSIVPAASTTAVPSTKLPATKSASAPIVWISPAEAADRLLNRTEPSYPPEAKAAHRAGDVVLEVQVAEDGSVSNIHVRSGDPLLAAAASAAVRNWRYLPYRQNDRRTQFQTDVTLTFNLPD
ncbi:MAG: TonB family protein [Terriglobales bacterium]|jgi:TonB family protein